MRVWSAVFPSLRDSWSVSKAHRGFTVAGAQEGELVTLSPPSGSLRWMSDIPVHSWPVHPPTRHRVGSPKAPVTTTTAER
jgi:hypothetical protein